ncbi:MAG: nucleotide pyrophosphohydrolase [Saprospiraceae bacterium]
MKQIQKEVDQWIQNYGVRYFNEMTNFTILTEEVGEMARYISRIYGEQSFKNPEDEITAKNNLKDEMADVLFVLCCLANQMNIDLEDAMKENMQKKTQRDKLRHIANEKLKG